MRSCSAKSAWPLCLPETQLEEVAWYVTALHTDRVMTAGHTLRHMVHQRSSKSRSKLSAKFWAGSLRKYNRWQVLVCSEWRLQLTARHSRHPFSKVTLWQATTVAKHLPGVSCPIFPVHKILDLRSFLFVCNNSDSTQFLHLCNFARVLRSYGALPVLSLCPAAGRGLMGSDLMRQIAMLNG